MKIRLLLLVAIGMFAFLCMSSLQNADALCMENQDWHEAPCYGCIGCYPGLEQEKIDWASYYDFKGVTWMNAKKQQLDSAIHNNLLREWFEKSDTGAHINIIFCMVMLQTSME